MAAPTFPTRYCPNPERYDGRMEYEGRLIYDNMLYEFKIDAYSGLIVEWEAENLNFYR